MSVDEFDPAIERLFAKAPSFADSAQFEAALAVKLNKSSRFRTVALSVAGLVGGVIAVREVLNVDFNSRRRPCRHRPALSLPLRG